MTSSKETQTFTVTITVDKFEKLKALANMQNIAATSALEQAIETEYYIKQQMMQGKRIILYNKHDDMRELVFR